MAIIIILVSEVGLNLKHWKPLPQKRNCRARCKHKIVEQLTTMSSHGEQDLEVMSWLDGAVTQEDKKKEGPVDVVTLTAWWSF